VIDRDVCRTPNIKGVLSQRLNLTYHATPPWGTGDGLGASWNAPGRPLACLKATQSQTQATRQKSATASGFL